MLLPQEDTLCSCNPGVNDFGRSSIWCPPFLFLAQSFPMAGANSIDGTAFCLVTATTKTKFSVLQ